jgi:hypothetical protein
MVGATIHNCHSLRKENPAGGGPAGRVEQVDVTING